MHRSQRIAVTAFRTLLTSGEQQAHAGPSSLRTTSCVRYASRSTIQRRSVGDSLRRNGAADSLEASAINDARSLNGQEQSSNIPRESPLNSVADAPGRQATSAPVEAPETSSAVKSSEPKSRSEPETNSEFAEQDKKPLPYLSAPLGVQKRPSSQKLSWMEKRDQQFDDSLRMQRRKAIVKEATRGYFHDVHAMRSHGGKTWIAPPTLIRHDRSLYFPAIEGTCLSDKAKKSTADILANKVSIVCILTSQVSEAHAKSFTDLVYPVFQSEKNFQLVQINLQENLLKAALVSLFASSIRRSIPAELQSTYLLSSQDLTMEKEALALHNKHVGYTYLVGPDLKIRWAGCAFATGKEAESLIACIGVLLTRMKEGGGLG